MRRTALNALSISTRCLGTSSTNSSRQPPHLLTLADLSLKQIQSLLTTSSQLKKQCRGPPSANTQSIDAITGRPLANRTVALLFSKLSTRTRVASESATALLGGHAMFLGSKDIQLGVNETLHDTTKIISSMSDGIMARVKGHDQIEEIAKHSSVPVINALSDLYHPTQILADLLTMVETVSQNTTASLDCLKGLKVAWVGDSNNILNDMIVSFDRIGINLAIATPKGYALDENVIATGKAAYDKEEACKNADIVITDTWISMGQEDEKAKRLKDFAGFQVTRDLMQRSGAKKDWKFMHCLPRKQEEVDDDVFYDSERSLVFQEGENRKWTTAAVFSHYFGRWSVE